MTDPKVIRNPAPSLGADVVGLEENDLALFRGITFASVSERWTHSVTRHSLDTDLFDATKFGPRCCQAGGLVMISGGVNDPTPGDDEFHCLNLNIATYTANIGDNSKGLLPVLVWIHGGAFQFGANSVARYRPQALLRHAQACGHPCVLVQVNYRLGTFGFAASSDLAAEMDGGSQTHPVGNFGLVDQRNALEWVNRHIQDFGGDPGNISIFGVSAGSSSIHTHLMAGHSHQLFDRAIMMSGAAPSLGPLPMRHYQDEWERLCRKAEVQASDPAQRLRQLRQLSAEEILRNSSTAAMGPVEDGKLVPAGWRFRDEVPRSRCKQIILGDTNTEGIVFDFVLKELSQGKFHERANATLGVGLARELREQFGFVPDGSSQPADDFLRAARLLFGNVLFNYSHTGIAEASCASKIWAGQVFLYHFEETSPFPGTTQGLSYHGFCALMMHLNELERVPAPTQKVSLETARLWTAFAHGHQPWEPYSTARRFMRLGPAGETGMHSFETDETRPYGYLKWLGEHLDEVRGFLRPFLLDLENHEA